uniref:Uncharacterized protein n=1 Tax=uncultured bacterium 253 TaxID=698385 RepID=E3T730_9BACT|nr:hypothetical protein [uncultured bacterium 253]
MRESSGGKTKTPETESDATSKETLEDIEADEKSSAVAQDDEGDSGVPSPDGAFGESGETKDAGPM